MAERAKKPRITAEGETWEASLDPREVHPGLKPLVFYCVTNSSWAWRVVEVPAQRFGGPDAISRLSTDELEKLFADADPLGVAREAGADPYHPGGHPGRGTTPVQARDRAGESG